MGSLHLLGSMRFLFAMKKHFSNIKQSNLRCCKGKKLIVSRIKHYTENPARIGYLILAAKGAVEVMELGPSQGGGGFLNLYRFGIFVLLVQISGETVSADDPLLTQVLRHYQ